MARDADQHGHQLSWGESVERFLQDDVDEQLLKDCYWDDPLLHSAERFAASEEWKAVRLLLGARTGRALDVGAGRGICSYALAADGWHVVALEPDPSSVVGAGAIRSLAMESGLPIDVVQESGERMPFDDDSFDLVFARQVLHHAHSLGAFCQEVSRVLKPGGGFLATREHVISRPEDLAMFQRQHPLHGVCAQESAHLLSDYTDAISSGGLKVRAVIGPFESAVNYFPMTRDRWWAICTKPLRCRLGVQITNLIASERTLISKAVLTVLARRASRKDDTPGRLYTFYATKPAEQ